MITACAPADPLPLAAATADPAARAAIAADIAATWADAVDREARFPAEAFAALRAQRLLAIMLPAELGGEDAPMRDIVDICYRLGQACSSTALIYAMHQACLACVLRHGQGAAWHSAFLRQAAAEQWLLASSTTEGTGGGNVRASAAPVQRHEDRIRLDRAATVVSYGAEADAIVTTARRTPDSLPSDQVLVVFRRADYRLESIGGWDTLGMRGTSSHGYTLRAEGEEAQILPAPYDAIHPQSMVPVSHLAWSGTWAGIAAGALERARRFIRQAARQNGGILPPGAPHFTEAGAKLQTLRGLIAASTQAYECIADNGAALAAIDFQTRMNLTKVQVSDMAVEIVLAAGRACGLSGYRNDSPFSIGRHLRDVLSAPIMINNDRIRANLGKSALVAAVPASLWA